MGLFSRVKNYLWSSGRAVASVGVSYFRLGTANVNVNTVKTSSGYTRAVIIISSQIGKLCFEIFDQNRNQIFDNTHHLLNVTPDGERTAHDWKTHVIDTTINRGNYFAQIQRTITGAPYKLIFIDAYRVTPYRDINDELMYRVAGIPTNPTVFELKAQDMFHIKSPWLTSDGLMGNPFSTHARNIMGVDLSLTDSILKFFNNVSLPIGLLTTTGKYGDEEQARMKRSFNKDEDNGNSDAPGGIAVLDKTFEYKLLEYKEDPLQFLNSRRFSIEEIARMLNINPAWLGTEVLKTVKLQELELNLYKDTLSPWISKFEGEVTMKLLNESYAYKYCKADTDELLMESKAVMGEWYTKMHQMSVFDANEIREDFNKPDVTNGDRRFVAFNNLKPIDRMDEMIDADILKSKPQLPAAPAKDVTPPKSQIEAILIEALSEEK